MYEIFCAICRTCYLPLMRRDSTEQYDMGFSSQVQHFEPRLHYSQNHSLQSLDSNGQMRLENAFEKPNLAVGIYRTPCDSRAEIDNNYAIHFSKPESPSDQPCHLVGFHPAPPTASLRSLNAPFQGSTMDGYGLHISLTCCGAPTLST